MFTDFLGKPINEGDEIVYAISSGYSGAAALERATVLKLIPLVTHPNRSGWVREDQAAREWPTQFSGKIYDDASKRYVVQIMRKRWRAGNPNNEQKFSIPNSNHVVVI